MAAWLARAHQLLCTARWQVNLQSSVKPHAKPPMPHLLGHPTQHRSVRTLSRKDCESKAVATLLGGVVPSGGGGV